MNSKLFFIKPFLSLIDNGKFFCKPFAWLYTLIAILNLFLPFYLLYQAINSGIFNYGGFWLSVAIVISWIIISFGCWLGFQIWWDRKDKISSHSMQSDELLATPAFSHFIQTLGEWLGTLAGYFGLIFGLLSFILARAANSLLYHFPIPFLGEIVELGIGSIFIAPIYGFIIIIATRFIAEQVRALATIANNTKQK